MWQSNINFHAPNKVEQEGLDSAIVSTMKVVEETLHKTPIAQEHTRVAHHMKTLCPVLVTLEEQFIALLFGHSNVNVALNKTGMIGHTRQMPKDLVSTSLT